MSPVYNCVRDEFRSGGATLVYTGAMNETCPTPTAREARIAGFSGDEIEARAGRALGFLPCPIPISRNIAVLRDGGASQADILM